MITKKTIREFTICVLGPSFVGKTSLIHRFMNNSFTVYYDPTEQCNYYKRAFNFYEDQEREPQFVKITIIDVFPQDHDLLEDEDEENAVAQEMQEKLNEIVNNQTKKDKKRFIDGYMFVYDSTNKYTFESMMGLIAIIKDIEESNSRGKKTLIYKPKKIVLGNKKDLKKKTRVLSKEEKAKLGDTKWHEVSALTNLGVYEAFKELIIQINLDATLQRLFIEEIKNKHKMEETKEEDEKPQIGPLKDKNIFSPILNMQCCSKASNYESEEESSKESDQDDDNKSKKSGQDGNIKTGGKKKNKHNESGCSLF